MAPSDILTLLQHEHGITKFVGERKRFIEVVTKVKHVQQFNDGTDLSSDRN